MFVIPGEYFNLNNFVVDSKVQVLGNSNSWDLRPFGLSIPGSDTSSNASMIID